jgi:hypothetical protein
MTVCSERDGLKRFQLWSQRRWEVRGIAFGVGICAFPCYVGLSVEDE